MNQNQNPNPNGNGINQQLMDAAINQFGGPQQFQQQINAAQNYLQGLNMSPEQFLQQQVQAGKLSQQQLDMAMQRANQIFGRR